MLLVENVGASLLTVVLSVVIEFLYVEEAILPESSEAIVSFAA